MLGGSVVAAIVGTISTLNGAVVGAFVSDWATVDCGKVVKEIEVDGNVVGCCEVVAGSVMIPLVGTIVDSTPANQ